MDLGPWLLHDGKRFERTDRFDETGALIFQEPDTPDPLTLEYARGIAGKYTQKMRSAAKRKRSRKSR